VRSVKMGPMGAGEFTSDRRPPELYAWVDESMRILDPAAGEGLYLLAAVVCDTAVCEPTRGLLRSLRYKRQPRLHWNTEDDGRRAKIAAAVSGVPMSAVVVVGAPLVAAKQERARRICMETLLPHLAGMGVNRVLLEARTASLNDRDRRHLVAMRGQRAVPATLRVDIGRPSVEPMLWLPDVVAGAVGAARNGNPSYLDVMRHAVTELNIPLR
jgi:hypothetical protein